MHSCLFNRSHFLAELVYRGYRTDARDQHGNGPLHTAFKLFNEKAIRTLLDGGADPTLLSNNGYTIVHVAVQTGILDMVRIALDAFPQAINANLLDTPNPNAFPLVINDRHTPLSLALRAGTLTPICIELIDRGSKIDNRCLDVAVSHRTSATWRYLITRGGRYVNREEITPAEYTVMVDAVEACRRLATACIGLGRVGGRVQGNGRDVLRLIAKEIWLTRMDDEWYRWNWEIRKRK